MENNFNGIYQKRFPQINLIKANLDIEKFNKNNPGIKYINSVIKENYGPINDSNSTGKIGGVFATVTTSLNHLMFSIMSARGNNLFKNEAELASFMRLSESQRKNQEKK